MQDFPTDLNKSQFNPTPQETAAAENAVKTDEAAA